MLRPRRCLFVPARTAGHSLITIPQRYIPPQAGAISHIFAATQVATKVGATRNSSKTRMPDKAGRMPLKSA